MPHTKSRKILELGGSLMWRASQLPLSFLCGYAAASVMPTTVQVCLGAETSESLPSSTEKLDRVATGDKGTVHGAEKGPPLPRLSKISGSKIQP